MAPAALVGALGHGAIAAVDDCGATRAGELTVDWWVGADDRWHVPADDLTTRRRRPVSAPLFETVMRVPGGEAAHRVYGAAVGAGALAVVEVENRSPAPFTVALVINVARPGRVEIDGTALRVGGEVVLALPRPPGAWASVAPARGERAALREIVTGGGARTGPFEGAAGPLEIALLFPVAHRTTLRAALADTAVDVREVPSADAVARGWDRHLERGMQAEIPSPVGALVDPARADLLLAGRDDPEVVAALEDWGFDAEAAEGWGRLGWSGRRRARTRARPDDPWAALVTNEAHGPARFLAGLWAVLVGNRRGVVDLLPGFPPEWLGQSVGVDAVPLPEGLLSFAVRWHGARPALLWESPDGVELRAPALDPAWSSRAPRGEALLSEPSPALLPMGERDASAGARVVAPEQFS
jgi:hypothetical protein